MTVGNTAGSYGVIHSQTYEERLREYKRQRNELLRLSKEALVDLIIHRPTLY